METAYYTVRTINGDYAYLVSDQGVENQVAMFLLPEGTDVGSRLKCEDFQWTLVDLGERNGKRDAGTDHGCGAPGGGDGPLRP